MIAMHLPTTIQKKRTVQIGGGAVAQKQQFNIGVDLVTQGLDDVRAILRQTIGQATAEQINLDNPPSIVLVDGRRKPVEQARYKVEVFFGATVQRAAMVMLEQALHNAIKRSTVRRKDSGDNLHLENIRESWQWIHIKGAERIMLGGPQDIKSFSNTDTLLLVPKLNYAGIVNVLVGKKSKRFTSEAVDAVRRLPPFRALYITSGYSQKNKLSDEISKYGSPYIVVKVSRGRSRGRR